MGYVHLLTFRWEQAFQVDVTPTGWNSKIVEGQSGMLDIRSLELTMEGLRAEVADLLECHPREIVVFLVNHTVVTA